MKNLLQLFSIAMTLGMTALLFASFHQGGDTIDLVGPIEEANTTNATHGMLRQVITSMDLTREYAFAGEPVPKQNFDAVERLDRELSVNSYLHASTLLNIKASYRYFQIIEPILARYGVPDDFKYLAVAESNLRNEVSPAGAKGIWQFLEATGAHYGLEINDEVDERYHLEKATEAACEYLMDYYTQFGSWTIAAAAYNMGGPRMKKYLAEQKANNYYDLNLNSETSRYIFRVIAIKEIMQNPVSYGFYLKPEEYYQPLPSNIVTIDGPIESLAEFAVSHGTTYRMLKVFNPWLITTKLTNKNHKTYELRIPPKE
jgi:membrane-bound lytic murein transglycosylase D